VATRGGRDGLESSCMKASSMRSERGSALGERIARSAAESEAMSPGRRLMLLPGEGVKKFQFSSMLVSWEGGLVSLEGCRGKRTRRHCRTRRWVRRDREVPGWRYEVIWTAMVEGAVLGKGSLVIALNFGKTAVVVEGESWGRRRWSRSDPSPCLNVWTSCWVGDLISFSCDG